MLIILNLVNMFFLFIDTVLTLFSHAEKLNLESDTFYSTFREVISGTEPTIFQIIYHHTAIYIQGHLVVSRGFYFFAYLVFSAIREHYNNITQRFFYSRIVYS